MKRDLQWVLQSPFLFYDPNQTDLFITQSDMDILPIQDIDLDAIAQHIITSYDFNRLGHYFEELTYNIIHSIRSNEVLLRNEQIKRNNKTLGEIDLLYRDLNTNQLVHLEMAIKFFISIDGSLDTRSLVGPNAYDRFDKKLELLISKQQHNAKFLNYEEEITSKILFKGYLFHPFNNGFKHDKSSNIPKDVDVGWYLRWSEFKNSELTEAKFIMLNKKEWCSYHETTNSDRIMDFKQLIQFIDEYYRDYQHAILVAVVDENENQWHEINRGFILPNEWPHES